MYIICECVISCGTMLEREEYNMYNSSQWFRRNQNMTLCVSELVTLNQKRHMKKFSTEKNMID